jgi:SAM-dependent methyltransferase
VEVTAMQHRPSVPSGSPAAPRFHETDRTAHRDPRPWHRLAHISRELPRAIERLVRALDLRPGQRVLDYGCADAPYRRFLPPGVEWVGADLPGNPVATTPLLPDGTVELPDASVDAVLSTQVLEHVANPARYLAECARVLRPGGRLLLSTHGIMVFHPDPHDWWRWTTQGLDRVVRDAGLEVEHFEGVMGLAATGLQLTQDALYWRIPRLLRHPFALVVQLLAGLLDRVEPSEAKKLNALVFAIVAVKP